MKEKLLEFARKNAININAMDFIDESTRNNNEKLNIKK